MKVIYTAAHLAAMTVSVREAGKSIGFIPTMGALHEGHLSLIRTCRQQNDFTVASIFVNPTQFNDKDDLKKYPRMPEKDLDMLRTTSCDVVFMPGEKEVYPEPDTRVFDFGGLDKVMEGKQRPGHFNGVAQVVTRLFDLVKPDRAYFGLKDFQQVTIIKKVVADLNYPVEIVPCPIVREYDGLAMSSRNMLLKPEERKRALVLSQSLFMAKKMKDHNTPAEVKAFVMDQIRSAPGIGLEYFEIVDGATLMSADTWGAHGYVIGCLAVRIGCIRLIDNIIFSS
jgi:pantoate--beta-alanine ligase